MERHTKLQMCTFTAQRQKLKKQMVFHQIAPLIMPRPEYSWARRAIDTLHGTGSDQIFWGGIGEDVFVFDKDSGRDWTGDFENGVDLIDITAWNVSNFEDVSIVSTLDSLLISHEENSFNIVGLRELQERNFIV